MFILAYYVRTHKSWQILKTFLFPYKVVKMDLNNICENNHGVWYNKTNNWKVQTQSLLQILILHENFLVNLLKKFARKDFFLLFF